MKIDLIAGARPNFMKIAPIIDAIKKAQSEGKDITYRLVHTGQHYDKNMSGSFFEELGIPEPDKNLAAGGGTQAEQTARIMTGYEALLAEESTDLCLVVGDVTSTMACSIVAKKAHIRVAHVEAGIRSGDLTMPEEINRLVTDSITDLFFTTSTVANDNLTKSGVKKEHIFFVGNTMIDTLLKNKDRLRQPECWNTFGLEKRKYLVLTLHRPSNVDFPEQFQSIITTILKKTRDYKILFPVHPRTRKMMDQLNINDPRLLLLDPLSYLEFNYMVANSFAVITDSGGITEETTVMGIPCMTLRSSTERPETCTIGTNELIGSDPAAIAPALDSLFEGKWKKGGIPPLWDGQTAPRIVEALLNMKSVSSLSSTN